MPFFHHIATLKKKKQNHRMLWIGGDL